MRKTVIYTLVLVGGTAFLGMVKLMYDMTGHMARMTDHVALMSTDMGRMRDQMETLVEQVSGIRESVQHMKPLAEDVHGMRENVGTMTGVIHRGGEQIERLNPAGVMQQMMTPDQRR
jgi:archaellum component FlaC